VVPAYFQLNYADGRNAVKLHPSRVIPFIGQELPDGAMGGDAYNWFWGDPLLQSVQDAIKAHDTTTGSITALLNEAKTDVVHIPGLMDSLASDEYENVLIERFALANFIKSITNALLLDGGDGSEGSGEQWEVRQTDFSGMPDMQHAMFQLVAGASDIPATRLIGQAPRA
jgi:phage-related protein (TIGR01555 family)